MSKKELELAAICDLSSHMAVLTKHVLDRGLKGSKLVKAFAMHAALGDRDCDKQEDIKRTADTAVEAEREWSKLTEAERVRILNGWHVASGFPTVADHLAMLAKMIGPETRWMLTVTGVDRVNFFADWELVDDNNPVFVRIMRGTPKDEALTRLRNILAALEEKWEEAIALDGREGLTTETEEQRIAVGDVVVDTGSDSGGGLKRAPDSHGGMPAVTDLGGGDPLAGLRRKVDSKA